MALFYEDVLRALQSAGVRFVLVGGVAVILHGVPRTTVDVDLVVDLDDANVRRLLGVMQALGFRPRAPVEAKDLLDPEKRREWHEQKGMLPFTFIRPDQPLSDVDILLHAPLGYADLEPRAERFEAEGLVLIVASPEDLIRLKEGTGRAQDAADIDALRRLLEERQRG